MITGRHRSQAAGEAGLSIRPRTLVIALLLLLALPILVSFAVAGDPLLDWASNLIERADSPTAIALTCVFLLAGDVLLPVPSSLVAASAASLLEPLPAVLAITLGILLSTTLGWLLGRTLRTTALERLISGASLSEADRAFGRWGIWAFACSRTVPILSEEFAILTGVHRLAFFRTVLPVTVASALPTSLFYVIAVRSLGLDRDAEPSFWALLGVASVLPILGLTAAFLLRCRSGRPKDQPPCSSADGP
jgi:membrane protein DedA with SNARE-associated domain